MIRGWENLRNWVSAEKNLELQRRLTPEAFKWKHSPQSGLLWNADPYLDVLRKEFLKSPDCNWFNQTELEFVQRSIQKKQRNVHNRWRGAIAVITILIVLLFATWRGQRRATIGQMLASTQTSESLLQGGQLTFDALLNSIRAANLSKQFRWKPSPQDQAEVVRNLRKAVYGVREVQRLEGFPGTVAEMFWQGDRFYVVTIEDRQTVTVWDAETRQDFALALPEADAEQVEMSPDRTRMAIASDDGTVRLWNWQQDTQATVEYKPHGNSEDSYVYQMQFSPSGRLLVTKGSDEFRIWNVVGNQVQFPNLQRQQLQGRLVGVGFTPEGEMLRVFQTNEERPDEGNVTIAQLVDSSGKWLNQLEMPLPGNIDQVDFSPDGDRIILYSGSETTFYSSVLEWHWKDNSGGNPYEQLFATNSLAFSSDGSLRATSGFDVGAVRLRRNSSIETEEFEAHQSEVANIAANADGSQLATESTDGTVRLWSLEPLPLSSQPLADSVQTVAFQPNSDQLVFQTTDRILHWHSGVESKEAPALFNTMQFSPDGQTLAAIAEDGTLHLMDAVGNPLMDAADNPLDFRNAESKFDSESNLAFSPNSKQIAVLVADEWNLEQPRPPRKLATVDVASGNVTNQNVGFGSIKQIAWRSIDHRIVLAVSGAFNWLQDVEGESGGDYSIRLWDIESNRQFAAPLKAGVRSTITSLSFDQSGNLMASADEINRIKLTYLDGTSMTEFQLEEDSIQTIILSPDGSKMATIAENGTATLWQIGDFDQLISQGCDRLRDYLQNPELTRRDRSLCNNVPPAEPAKTN
ncbi:MAG: WD40 repeat domain-containing protein [Leptolyngbyaceae cyanobacterium SL_7_1]|nr:WD40 repeat domain-containing protein [Leptolyngbyaceae cyanobacterium SL_7_1]